MPYMHIFAHRLVQICMNLSGISGAVLVVFMYVICLRPDWGAYSKRGRQICIASTCLLINFWKASL